jgi:type IV pilus assembly protein PilO
MASFFDTAAAKIQKIPSKTRMIGFGIFVLVIVGLFIYFVHIPKTTQITQLKTDIAKLQATVLANDEQIKQLDALKQEVKNLEEKLRLLKEQLPPESEVSGLLRQIQNLVNQSGLSLKLWQPKDRKMDPSGLFEQIPISVQFNGAYHDVGVFLDRVSKLTRIVNMLNMKMGSASMNKGGRMTISVSCTALTFAGVEKKPDAGPPAVKKNK